MVSVVSQIPNESIIVIKTTNPFDPQGDVEHLNTQIAMMSQNMPRPVYIISDLSELDMSFSDLVTALDRVKRDPRSSINNSDMVNLTVGSAEMVKLSVDAAKQAQYGGANVQLFASVDEALAYARKQMRG